jgi:predicted nucleic acid-binding protein
MLYFDSTYLFRIYSEEPGNEAVKALLAHHNQPVAIAWHGRAEIASVLLRKRREGADTPAHLGSLAKQFHDDCQQLLIQFLPLTEAVMIRLEAVFGAAPSATNLRAADALHLACAAEHGFLEVHSNDRLLLAAAPLFGLCGINIIP